MLGMTKARFGADSDFTSIAQASTKSGPASRCGAEHGGQRASTVARDEPPAARRADGARASRAHSWRDLDARGRRQGQALRPRPASSALVVGRSAVEPAGRRRRARATPAAPRGGAGIIGTRDVVSVQDAAFANGVIGHGLVRDDMHVGSVSHLGTVLVPALLALAETTKSSGKDFLDRARRGLRGRRQDRPHDPRRRSVEELPAHRHHGPDRAPRPPARSCSASTPTQTATALALGANTAAGYNEWAATGGSEMFFHTGLAARSAVTAVQLAADGAYASRTADRRRGRPARGVPQGPRAR